MAPLGSWPWALAQNTAPMGARPSPGFGSDKKPITVIFDLTNDTSLLVHLTSIQRCDAFLRRELLQNLVLDEGSTMFTGMAEGVEHDHIAKVIAAPERKNGAWLGRSIFASIPVLEQRQRQ
jgi:actin-related protein